MKHPFFINLIIVSLIIFSSSCKDYLQEIPKDRFSEENFYKTVEDAKVAVNAIYAAIHNGDVFGRSYFQQVEIKADYLHGRGSTNPIEQYQGLDQVNINRVDLIWNGLYQAILYANIAIEKIGEMTAVDETKRKELVAEARFMRAFAYYHLVINWGAVPLVLSTADMDLPRAPVPDVYDAIIEDLETGESDLPDNPEQFGHPTKWSAKSFLSLVYLTMEQFDKARDKANEVITSGKFSLVSVAEADDFDKIFGASANGTSEEIFYLKHNHDKGWEWPLNLVWESSQYAPFGNFVVFTEPDNLFIKNWNTNDLRQQFDLFTEYIDPSTGQVEQLPSSTPVLVSKFRDPNTPGRDKFANDFTFLRYADILLIYAEASDMADHGPGSQAIENLNMIKRRAYGYNPESPSPVDYPASGWTEESFRDSVIKERGYEFFVEGKRWQDLRRTGKAADVILQAKGIVIKQASLLWPIPQQEIDTNPNIGQEDQNPGY